MVVTVLIVDDSSYARDGLRSILGHDAAIEVVGEAENGCDAIEQAMRLRPDVILMDLQMPAMDGLEATRCIKTHLPLQRVICLAVHPHNGSAALDAGASSYLLKDAPRDQLLAAIRGSVES
ncbi:MAG: response regulator [Chloroflexota bacterium]